MSAGELAVRLGESPADRPAAPALAAALSVGTATLAAVILPGQPVGLGLFLVGVAITASVAVAHPRVVTLDVALLAGLGLALSAMTVVRAAEWVVFLDLVYALLLAALIVSGSQRWIDLVRAPLAVASRAHQALPFLGRGLAPGDRLLRRAAPALRGTAIAAGLLVVFGSLFITADAAFSRLANDWLLPDWDLGLLPFRVFLFVVVLVVAGALIGAGDRFAGLGRPWLVPSNADRKAPGRGLGRLEWAIALGLLDLLFAAFVAVQVAMLFGGRDHVLGTAGLTYAEYARQGFFQLVLVAVLTLAVVGGSVRWTLRERPADRRLLQVLLGLLCGLTLVVLASALRRLLLYEDTFGFTRLRVSVHASILWLAGILILVMLAGALWRGTWLPRAAVVFTGVSLLVFSAANPDGLIASRNVDRFRATGSIDTVYLSGLSADAVPALTRLPSGVRACVLGSLGERLSHEESALSWNLGRERARSALNRSGAGDCLF